MGWVSCHQPHRRCYKIALLVDNRAFWAPQGAPTSPMGLARAATLHNRLLPAHLLFLLRLRSMPVQLVYAQKSAIHCFLQLSGYLPPASSPRRIVSLLVLRRPVSRLASRPRPHDHRVLLPELLALLEPGAQWPSTAPSSASERTSTSRAATPPGSRGHGPASTHLEGARHAPRGLALNFPRVQGLRLLRPST